MNTSTDYHFDEIVQFAARLCQAPMAAISLVADDRFHLKAKIGLEMDEMTRSGVFCNEVVLTQAPVVIVDALQDVAFKESALVVGDIGARAYLGQPIKDEYGNVVGSLCVIDVRSRVWTDIEREGMNVLAAQVFGSIELHRTNEELVRLWEERRDIETRWRAGRRDDHRRIAAELHDGLGQDLTGISLMLRALQNRTAELETRSELKSIEKIVMSAFDSCRQIALAQNMVSSMQGSLGESIERFLDGVSATTAFQCRLTWPADTVMNDAAVAYNLYRGVQEAVTNAVKHSAGNCIAVECEVQDGLMILSIDDDGMGLPVTGSWGQGVGLDSMRFRAAASGGQVSYVRREPSGLRVQFQVPMNSSVPSVTAAQEML